MFFGVVSYGLFGFVFLGGVLSGEFLLFFVDKGNWNYWGV